MTAYQKLKDHLVMVSNISKGSAILEWDMEVMMPPHATQERGQILATLGALEHEKLTDPRMADWINDAENEVESDWDKRNLELIKQNYLLDSSVSEKLVYALEEAKSKTVTLWQEAKPNNDWNAVQSALENLFSLIKERAEIYAGVLNRSVYDAQMFRYARGNTQEKVDPLFDHLRKDLPPLVQKIIKHQAGNEVHEFELSEDAQRATCIDLVQKLGYSFDRGRLDVASHPFSGGTGNDSRITNRYSTEAPFTSFYGAIHETGHALYTQNLPKEWAGLPVGGDSDLSLHESQSLIMEKQAGLNNGFMHYLHGLVVQHDSEFSIRTSADAFAKELHKVQPSFIRVDADEATYSLHVVLRYEIEKKLFAGQMAIGDIPEMWNTQFKELIGIDVPEHRLGCMQDIHWFWGLFGYFPTYTQGALYAAQLFHAMKKDVPKIDEELAHGDLTSFNKWLNEKIHRWGQLYDAPTLIERATGEKPDAKYFLDHLKNRYL